MLLRWLIRSTASVLAPVVFPEQRVSSQATRVTHRRWDVRLDEHRRDRLRLPSLQLAQFQAGARHTLKAAPQMWAQLRLADHHSPRALYLRNVP